MLAVFNWTEQTRSHTIRFVELQLRRQALQSV